MSFEKILELADHYGIAFFITATLLFFAISIGIILLKRFADTKKLFQPPMKHTLNNHNLFTYLDRCLNISVLHFEDEDKEVLFRVLLICKFKSYKEVFYEFNKMDFYNMTNSAFKKENIKLLSKGRSRYESKLIELGYPKFVLNKFHEWHIPHIDGVVDGVESISYDDIAFENQVIKQHAVYHSLHTGFKLTKSDAQASLGSLNGEVKKWIKNNPKSMEKIKMYLDSQ